MGLKCIRLKYNWRPYGDTENGLDHTWDEAEVGEKGVVEIMNMTPVGEDIGIADWYDVVFEDGSRISIYNPNMAFWAESQK